MDETFITYIDAESIEFIAGKGRYLFNNLAKDDDFKDYLGVEPVWRLTEYNRSMGKKLGCHDIILRAYFEQDASISCITMRYKFGHEKSIYEGMSRKIYIDENHNVCGDIINIMNPIDYSVTRYYALVPGNMELNDHIKKDYLYYGRRLNWLDDKRRREVIRNIMFPNKIIKEYLKSDKYYGDIISSHGNDYDKVRNSRVLTPKSKL